MQTTAIFAEILTIGLQCVVWVALMLMQFNVISLPDSKSLGDDWFALITSIVLAFAYSAGIIIDRIADDLTSHSSRRKKRTGERARTSARKGLLRARAKTNALLKAWSVTFAIARLRVHQDGGGMVDQLEYQRSRIRIARATQWNLIPIGIFGALLANDLYSSPLILFATAVAILACRYAYLRISTTYEERVPQAYRLIVEAENRAKPNLQGF